MPHGRNKQNRIPPDFEAYRLKRDLCYRDVLNKS